VAQAGRHDESAVGFVVGASSGKPQDPQRGKTLGAADCFMSTRIRRRLVALAPHLVCVLCCLTPPLLSAEKIRIVFQTVPREVVVQRLQRLHSKNAERETELKTMFAEAGCKADQLQEHVVRRKDPPNVICTLPGTTNSLIIVGAHFDHGQEGTGAVDNWSGASLLPSLYQALKGTPRRHTFVFVGFTDEEKGLVGSNYYVQHFPKDRLSTIKAMVNLECLGLGSTAVWAHTANKGLLGALISVTQSMHVVLRPVDVQNVGNDDTQAFRDKKLPVVTIHSVTQETWPLLHSAQGDLAAIHLDDLYESYRVVSEYLTFIDEVLN
jgi:putative aminopeptidase FrvX